MIRNVAQMSWTERLSQTFHSLLPNRNQASGRPGVTAVAVDGPESGTPLIDRTGFGFVVRDGQLSSGDPSRRIQIAPDRITWRALAR